MYGNEWHMHLCKGNEGGRKGTTRNRLILSSTIISCFVCSAAPYSVRSSCCCCRRRRLAGTDSFITSTWVATSRPGLFCITSVAAVEILAAVRSLETVSPVISRSFIKSTSWVPSSPCASIDVSAVKKESAAEGCCAVATEDIAVVVRHGNGTGAAGDVAHISSTSRGVDGDKRKADVAELDQSCATVRQ